MCRTGPTFGQLSWASESVVERFVLHLPVQMENNLGGKKWKKNAAGLKEVVCSYLEWQQRRVAGAEIVASGLMARQREWRAHSLALTLTHFQSE